MALRPLLALSSFSVLFSFLYTVLSAAPTSSPLGPTIEAYWQLSAGSSVSSSPSITEDGSTIVFTSDGGIVYAGDIANQTIAWQTTMPTVQFGTPAAPALYEPAGLVISCSVSQCVGLSLRNGSIVWARNNTAAPANYTGPSVAPAVNASTGIVYGGAASGEVFALNASTGTLLWSTLLGANVYAGPLLTPGGMLLIGSNDGMMNALAADTGAKIWIFATGEPIVSTAVLMSPTVAIFGSNDSNVYALDIPSHTPVWKYTAAAPVVSSAGMSPDGSAVIFGSLDGNVTCVSATTGKLMWTVETWGPVRCPPTFSANGLVFIGSDDTNLYTLSLADGSVVWQYRTNGAVRGRTLSSPLLPGTVFLPSFDGNVYALSDYIPLEAETGITLVLLAGATLLTVGGGIAGRKQLAARDAVIARLSDNVPEPEDDGMIPLLSPLEKDSN